jgi:uncharacterized damage-inducible protein DinB
LLENLYEQTEQNIYKAISEWQQLPAEFLTAQPGLDKWSAAQCLEHLNSYGRYYLPAMAKAIATSANTQMTPQFKSGWLGHYFYNLMLTNGNGKVKKKMASPKAHRPPVQLNVAQVLSEFISQQEMLMQLITQSHTIDLNKAMVPVSIAPFIKLKLGDTLLFYIAHIDRHIAQAERALRVAGYMPSVNKGVMA